MSTALRRIVTLCMTTNATTSHLYIMVLNCTVLTFWLVLHKAVYLQDISWDMHKVLWFMLIWAKCSVTGAIVQANVKGNTNTPRYCPFVKATKWWTPADSPYEGTLTRKRLNGMASSRYYIPEWIPVKYLVICFRFVSLIFSSLDGHVLSRIVTWITDDLVAVLKIPFVAASASWSKSSPGFNTLLVCWLSVLLSKALHTELLLSTHEQIGTREVRFAGRGYVEW